MAFSVIGGNIENNKTASTSVSSGNTVALGDLACFIVAKDNANSGDGDFSEVTSVTDNLGNTYTKVGEYTNGQGGAGNGATISVFYTVVTNAGLATATANFSSSTTAKTWTLFRFGTAGTGVTLVTPVTAVADGANVPSMTVSGLTSGTQYLGLRVSACEASLSAITNTSGWSGTATGTTGGGGAANMSLAFEYIITSSVTSLTSAPTVANSDNASLMFAFYEGSAPPPPPAPVSTGNFLQFF